MRTRGITVNGVLLTAEEVRRLPVLEGMLQDMNEESVVLQAPGFSAAALKAFASCDPEDYVLPPLPHDRDEAVRSLEWAGVDTAELRTARELRAERRRHHILLNRGMVITQCLENYGGGGNRNLGIPAAGGVKAWTGSDAFRSLFRHMSDREDPAAFNDDMRLLAGIAMENEAQWQEYADRRA
jgi:hypothetical protein